MDIAAFLNGLPILGLVFQLLGYVIEVFPNIAHTTMAAAVPYGFAALCGVM